MFYHAWTVKNCFKIEPIKNVKTILMKTYSLEPFRGVKIADQ